MAEASKTVEMDSTPEQLWSVITDYENYPKFINTVSSVKVLSRENGKARVQYGIELLGKQITYVLDHVEQSPNRMTWSLVESGILKSNSGGWEIKAQDSKIEVTYRLALEFKIFVPGMVLNGLVKSSLPQMLEQVAGRVKEVHGNG